MLVLERQRNFKRRRRLDWRWRKVLVIRLVNVERASFALRFATQTEVQENLYRVGGFKTEIKRVSPCLFEAAPSPKVTAYSSPSAHYRNDIPRSRECA